MDNASNSNEEEVLVVENPAEVIINKPQSPAKKKGGETDKRLAALIEAGVDKHDGWDDVVEAHERA